MVFKFLIVLIFIVKVNSQIETVTFNSLQIENTTFNSEHGGALVVRGGPNLCQGSLKFIPPLQRRRAGRRVLIEKFE